MIGYTAPGNTGKDGSATTNFTYGKGEIEEDNSAEVGGTLKSGWTASNAKDLNDCTAGENWIVKVSDGSSLKFQSTANGAGCVALTPTFANIGQ